MKAKVKTRNVSKIGVERIKGNWRSYPYLYPIGDLTQRNFYKCFHMQQPRKALKSKIQT